jgi:hypothetical protein
MSKKKVKAVWHPPKDEELELEWRVGSSVAPAAPKISGGGLAESGVIYFRRQHAESQDRESIHASIEEIEARMRKLDSACGCCRPTFRGPYAQADFAGKDWESAILWSRSFELRARTGAAVSISDEMAQAIACAMFGWEEAGISMSWSSSSDPDEGGRTTTHLITAWEKR